MSKKKRVIKEKTELRMQIGAAMGTPKIYEKLAIFDDGSWTVLPSGTVLDNRHNIVFFETFEKIISKIFGNGNAISSDDFQKKISEIFEELEGTEL